MSILLLVVGFPSLVTPATSPGPFYSSPAKLVSVQAVNALESTNWAGYAINAPAGTVTQAKGSWIQPSVTCPSSGAYLAAFWAGIDGFINSPTVEQTGTIAQCVNGVATYYAWYEFYPAGSVEISSIVIKPGDVISATVKYSSTTGKFTTTIKDVTTGKSYTKSASVLGALRSSAEWIEEAPSYCNLGCLYAMPNFGTASYGKDSTSVLHTNSAIISGSTKVISKFGSEVDSITMISSSSATTIKATPSSLSSDGASFSVAFVSAGP